MNTDKAYICLFNCRSC